MQKKRSARRNRTPEWLDFGPPERLARAEVVIIGEGRVRQARVVDVVSRFNEREQHAALHILHLAEAARFDGYHCSRLSFSSYAVSEDGPSARASHARLALYRIGKMIEPKLWSAIWFVLIAGETQALFAMRAHIQRRHVRPMLQAGLAEVANILHR